MNNTQKTELIHIIGKTWVSFLSIVFFVMLGTCVFLGVNWSISGFSETVESTLETGDMFDCDITYPYGFTSDAIDAIKTLKKVSRVEGYYTSEQHFTLNDMHYQAKVIMLTRKINTPTMVEGTLPKHCGEIAVEKHWATLNGVSLGDTIRFDHDAGDRTYLLDALLNGDREYLENPYGSEAGMEKLCTDTFRVTALIEVPEYINQYRATYGVSTETSIPNDCLLFVAEESFDSRAFGGYSSLLVLSDSLRQYDSVSDEYIAENEELAERIKKVLDRYTQQRYTLLSETISYIEKSGETLPDGIALQEYDCAILARNTNPGLGITTVPRDTLVHVKYTMTLLFVLVGVLVCYSTMSRIVFEQSVLIGAKKALGFTRREIVRFYLFYALNAVVLGSVAGNLLARFAVEKYLVQTLTENFNVTQPECYYSLPDAVLFFLFEAVSTLLFAYAACRRVLRRNAVELLSGNDEKRGKIRFYEDSPIWEHLSLLNKTIINNCLNDKRRTFATLTGIIGCCSIMVCALTLLVSLYHTYDYQMSHVTKYDTLVYVDPDREKAFDEIDRLLRSRNIEAVPLHFSSLYLKTSTGGYTSVSLLAYEDERFYDYFGLSRDGEDCVADDGLWICKAFGKYHSLTDGDEVDIVDSKGALRSVPISGVFDHYLLRSYMVTDASHYEELFEDEFSANAMFFSRGDSSIAELSQLLGETEGFLSVFDTAGESWESYGSIISAVSVIAVTFIVQAVLLSFLVILNLLVMFVSEKKQELIVMMINGYSRRRAKRYIYADTILLTLIGVVLGCALGIGAGFVTLNTFESESVTIIKEINLRVCALCAGFTAFLVFLNSCIALGRVNRFRLSDISEI